MSLNLDTLSRLLSQEKIEDTKTVIKNPLLIYISIYIYIFLNAACLAPKEQLQIVLSLHGLT
jgi:hypothetical protein